MRIRVKATNIDLSPDVKNYAIEKITSLERFLPDIQSDSIITEIELGRPSKRHRTGEVFRCEVNLTINGKLLRAEEKGRTIIEAIDKVRDEIEGRVRKTKDKRQTNILRSARKAVGRFKFFKK